MVNTQLLHSYDALLRKLFNLIGVINTELTQSYNYC